MKLQLIVPHYNEDPKWVIDYLDSLQLQRFVDKSEFEVLLLNDGDKVVLDEAIFKNYDFSIKYIVKPWGGISDTRQYGQDIATADYIMYCDCDDMFSGVDSMYNIFQAMKKADYDLIIGCYVHGLEDGSVIQETSQNARSQAMIHGKIFKRRFLLDHCIVWDKSIVSMHEDYYYYSQVLAENPNIGLMNNIIYFWRYRPNSMSNHDAFWWRGEEINRLKVEYKVLVELKKRKAYDSFKLKLIDFLFNTYYLYPSAKHYDKEAFIEDMLNLCIDTFRGDISQLVPAVIKARVQTIGPSRLADLSWYNESLKGWLDRHIAAYDKNHGKKESE